MKLTVTLSLILAVVTPAAFAQITIIPPGFAYDKLLDQIDGSTPRLDAISNPAYGYGVIAASVGNGILTVKRISNSSVEVLGTLSGFAAPDVKTIRFDRVGIFNFDLLISVREGVNETHTLLYRVETNGVISLVTSSFGGSSDYLSLVFDNTDGTNGYIPGMYLYDTYAVNGTSVWHLDPNLNRTRLKTNCVPPGRSDLDVRGLEFDSTGVFGYGLIMADSDPDSDNKTAVYNLFPDLTWSEITTPIPTQQIFFGDMCISPGGAFGQIIYVTDKVGNKIMTVDEFGNYTDFAIGFDGIGSVSAGVNGDNLFVSDGKGVYRIRPSGNEPGPTMIMREPKVEPDDFHSGRSGIDSVRLYFSDPIVFTSADVSVTDNTGQPVSFNVVGSGTNFLLVNFGEVLHTNRYTITVHDTAVSATNGVPIDGDNDGINGGDLEFSMKHKMTLIKR